MNPSFQHVTNSMTTDGNRLAFPALCGLIATNPSKLSQAMHNAGFKDLGLKFSYHAFSVDKTEDALDAVRALGLRGLSLTIPHKERALSLVDELSEDSKKIGAINTLINSGSNLTGYNTDWYGIVEALKEVEFDASNSKAILLGAGGAARAAVYALQSMGVSSIEIANRSKDRADSIAEDFQVSSIELSEVPSKLKSEEKTLLINSTPLGSAGEGIEVYPFSEADIANVDVVFEMVTKETALTISACAQNVTVVKGIRMLLHQALKQFELFTGESAPIAAMEKALIEEYSLI